LSPGTNAAPAPPEPTFTLADFHRAFGHNYAGFRNMPDHPVTPLDVALDAIDELKRGIELCNEALHASVDLNDAMPGAIHHVLTNLFFRADAAIEVLGRFRSVAPKSETAGA
jgi:hypothetical protein